jgi:spore cortex formation protein SpoVR/YcgB (stage V sporulation)
MAEIRLIDEFKDWAERIIDNLPQKIKDTIKTYMEKYGKMELNELLDYVYAKYPEYAVKSKRKRRRR